MDTETWYDMNHDEQAAFIDTEAERIAVRHVRRLIASGKRSEKKVESEPTEQVAQKISQAAARKIASVLILS